MAQPEVPADRILLLQRAVPRPGRTARLAVPLLLLAVAGVWAADLRTPYEARLLLMVLNFTFLTLASAAIVVLVARRFLESAKPELLLLGCGAFFFGAAGVAGAIVAAFHGVDAESINMRVTLHNVLFWVSACCHLAGAAFSVRWGGLVVGRPRRWLAGAALMAAAVLGSIALATLESGTPVFFTADGGPTPVRQWLMVSAIAMFALTAALLHAGNRPSGSLFVDWYVLALQLLALGLLGLTVETTVGGVGSWLGRAVVYLGGVAMLLAAVAAVRQPGGPAIMAGPVRGRALHIYGIAVAIVLAAAVVRLVFLESLGSRVAFLTFFPAVMIAALYAGFRAGLAATVASLVLAIVLWIGPPGASVEGPLLLAWSVFFLSAVIIAWFAGSMHDALDRTQRAEGTARKLNSALRLLGDFNLAVARARDEQQLLGDLCRLVVESGGYMMAWVGVARQDAGKSVEAIAQSGYEAGYLDKVRISWDGDQDIGRGPTGTAIRSGRPAVRLNCPTDPLLMHWRRAIVERGFRSSVAIPFMIEGQGPGALTIYAAEDEAFGEDEVKLLQELAGNVMFGLQSLRARRELERHRQELEVLVTERTQEISALNAELVARVAEAEAATHHKSTFLATMSHEIRTPLNAVVGLVELLADTPLDRHQRDCAEKIQLSAQALCDLIDGILDFSRIEAGALQLERAPFSLDALLRTAAAIVSVRARGKPIEILFDVAPDVPDALLGDSHRVQQILLNLAGNAVKFTESGTIMIAVRPCARHAGQVTLLFIVQDTGIGIKPEQQKQIFESFVQGDSSVSRKHGGTGLGLAICSRLVALMGGQIDVTSRPGRGSKFFFTVPLAVAESAEAAIPDGPPAECAAESSQGNEGPPRVPLTPSGGGCREAAARERPDLPPGLHVLIVDDHPLARDVLARTCAQAGWQATALDSGLAGLDELWRSAAEGRDYDLLLLDWRMPGIDGIEMLRQAYTTPGVALPLVLLMVSAFEQEQAIAASDDVYLDGLVTKPILPSLLFEAVARVYSGKPVEIPPTVDRQDRPLTGMSLLVAEDNELNQQVIRHILARAGAKVTIAGDGLAAVDILRRTPDQFDAVLMDIQMPVLDGHQATRIIREELGLVDLPIIAVTAHALPENRDKSQRAGMDGHLVKPINVDDLLDLLADSHRGWRTSLRARPEPGSAGESAMSPAVDEDRLPGLDVAAVLPIFGGDRQALGKMLREFIGRHGDDSDKARQLAGAGDREAAARLIHELRGVTSFLQAADVARLAGAVETALRDGGDGGMLSPLLDDLEVAMRTLAASIDQFDAVTAAR